MALELPAVRKAATVADPTLSDALQRQRRLMQDAAAGGDEHEFAHHDLGLHDLILDAADNARARAIVKTLRETTRLLGANTADRTRTLTDIDDEHAPIIDAIIAGDPDGAEAAMRVHLVNTGKLLVTQAVLSDDSASPSTTSGLPSSPDQRVSSAAASPVSCAGARQVAVRTAVGRRRPADRSR